MAHVVIVGTGIAGLTTALRLAGRHQVTVVTKGRLGESATALAQGGIAGALFPDDSVESHIADTLAAGAGLCDEAAVRVLCTEGPERILDLAAAGVRFDRASPRPVPGGGRLGAGAAGDSDAGTWRDWARGLEGAHSVPRIYHSGGDGTGRAIIDALTLALRAEAVAGTVDLREDTMLVDVLTADGASTGAAAPRGRTGRRTSTVALGVSLLAGRSATTLSADAVVLATGGAGQLFAHTTNPPGATGDGLAAAIRAGAAVRDMEFVQFHPTALAGTGLLISEAVRGAGALLLDASGERFMPSVDARAELAPRDVVALAIHRSMAAQAGAPCFLDARAVPEAAARFPSIAGGLAEHGLDLARDLIPVTPAAHYLMGGIATDLDGRTGIDGLYAVGEVARTGVHGANRLASNSLLEGAVFGVRTARALERDLADPARLSAGGDRSLGHAGRTPVAAVPSRPGLSRARLRDLAWAHLGVERDAPGLRTVLDLLGAGAGDDRPVPQPHLADPGDPDPGDPDARADLADARADLETANLALVARTIAAHALAREGSRGAHVRVDSPAPAPPLEEALTC